MGTPPRKIIKRCAWADANGGTPDRRMQRYHDEEWGVPLHGDRQLLESLILDGAQAGLSWRTILHRRDGYRKAFHRFDARRIARMGASDIRRLLKDPGIIRNRAKIVSAIGNARAFLRVQKEWGSFDRYIWTFAPSRPAQRRRRTFKELPVTSPEAQAMSLDLRRRGFTFVGPTICYAFMQAVGMVDDHLHGCFRSGDSSPD